MASIIPWDKVKELLDGIDELKDKIEDIEKWQEFAERMDRARNGQIGDPVELMAILVDLLEYLADKVPMGSLERLVRPLLDVAIGALEAGASLVRWILLLRYRRRRAAGQSPAEASRGVTNDRAAQIWLRLQEQKTPHAEDDPEARDESGVNTTGAVSQPAFPDDPKPWPDGYEECCGAGDNGTMPPMINEMTSSSSRRIPPPNTWEYEVEIEFDFSHPCGIASASVRAFTRAWPGAGQADPSWIEMPQPVSTGSAEQQFTLHMQSTTKGKRGKAKLMSAGDAMLVYHVVSNCGTRSTRYARVIS